ncbi:MAG: 3'-5' exonuclease [Motiliproteus sp.]
MRRRIGSYIVIDFEATCSETGEFLKEEMEVIEFGCVAVDYSGSVLSEFESFVKPVRNPVLTDFCEELTTITQAQVDAAPKFPEVLVRFKEWLSQFENPVFCSWGYYDRNQLAKDCDFHGVKYPFPTDEHINVKLKFSKIQDCRPKGLKAAVERVGLAFEGSYHRGIDDARNVARLLSYVGLVKK